MIQYKQVGTESLPMYDTIPMLVPVTSIYTLEKVNRGLGGILLQETPVKPYTKDLGGHEQAARYKERFDITNWAFFMAFEGDMPVGGATVAAKTEGVNMLAGRSDLSVLWDLRVDCGHKRMGVGKQLFQMTAAWSREQGFAQMKIECQNNNVPACRFYHGQGAVLGEVNEYAYYSDPALRGEAQLIWYLDL